MPNECKLDDDIYINSPIHNHNHIHINIQLQILHDKIQINKYSNYHKPIMPLK